MADPLISPDMAEWLRQKQAALEQAYAQDKSAQADEDRKALLMQFANQFVYQRPMPVQPRKVGDARERFGAMTGLEKEARVPGILSLRAQMQAEADARKAAEAEKVRATERGFRSEEAEKGREFRAGEGEKSRAAQLRAAEIAAGRKQEEKAADRARKHYIGEDFEDVGADRELQGGVLAEAQKRVAAGRQVLKDTDEILDLLRTHGTEVVGPYAAKLSALATNIQLNEKELKNLGVLNGRDLEILERLARDPTEIRSILKSASNIRPVLSIFEALRDLTVSDVNALGQSLGFRAKRGGSFSPREPEAAAPAPSARRPRRTDPATGETREWDGTRWVPIGG